MALKTKQVSYRVSSYSDIEKYIKEVFKLDKPFEIYPKSNDTEESYLVDSFSKMSAGSLDFYTRYTRPDAIKLVEQGCCESYQLGDILQYMNELGYLEPDLYLVEYSW